MIDFRLISSFFSSNLKFPTKKGNFFVSDAIAQLAVDNTRNILYTRSEKGTIQVLRTLEMI